VPNPEQIDMLNFRGMRFPIDVILVCIRWYAAYPLSYRHLEEIMEGFCRISERGGPVG
jgi:transposase-like protein